MSKDWQSVYKNVNLSYAAIHAQKIGKASTILIESWENGLNNHTLVIDPSKTRSGVVQFINNAPCIWKTIEWSKKGGIRQFVSNCEQAVRTGIPDQILIEMPTFTKYGADNFRELCTAYSIWLVIGTQMLKEKPVIAVDPRSFKTLYGNLNRIAKKLWTKRFCLNRYQGLRDDLPDDIYDAIFLGDVFVKRGYWRSYWMKSKS